MAPRTDFSFLSDLGLQLAAWEETYVSEAGLDRYRRACAWVTSESAKQVATSITDAIASTIDRPTPWISRAYQYTRALTRGTSDAVSADAFVLDDQSIVLKHLFGDGRNTRLPGDVGLAKEHILVHGKMIKAYYRPRAPPGANGTTAGRPPPGDRSFSLAHGAHDGPWAPHPIPWAPLGTRWTP